LAPLWGRQPAEVLKEAISSGFEIVITSVAAEGFDESWLGRRLDESCCRELLKLCERFGIDPVGEGGEYETFVTDGPLFKKRIRILKAKRKWEGTRGHYLIEQATLEEKR
jgi:predicted ATP pyrophosphatase (TIGR00289 family)